MTVEHNEEQGNGSSERGSSGERARDAGTVVRDEFGARQIARTTEKNQTALAARATAEIQAAFVMARNNPRDLMEVRDRLLKAAARPGFAETAIYAKPIGKVKNKITGAWEDGYATGASIRLVEEALRCLGNAIADSSVIEDVPSTPDDPGCRTFRVVALDLETNLRFSCDVPVIKTVERSKLRKGQVPYAVRTNSSGYAVYIVEATEDDMLMKSNSQVSKAIRTNGQRLIPGDILDEVKRRCLKTQADQTAKDPNSARKSLADAFSAIGITPAELARYLGHPLESATVDELIELKAVGVAIKEGHGTWREILDARLGDRDEPDPDGEPKKTPAAAAVEAIKEKLKASGKPADQPPPTPGATVTPTPTAATAATTSTVTTTTAQDRPVPTASATTATAGVEQPTEREPGDDDGPDPDGDDGDPSGKAAEAFERAEAAREAERLTSEAKLGGPTGGATATAPTTTTGKGMRIGTPKGGTK